MDIDLYIKSSEGMSKMQKIVDKMSITNPSIMKSKIISFIDITNENILKP